ncbi:uncharacterized protein [Eurosta solidaginis]|uniref:uncharacterized protein n=1 Tax=Eurosta solidaginis TaxID=178769 RepID=UPI0035313CC5
MVTTAAALSATTMPDAPIHTFNTAATCKTSYENENFPISTHQVSILFNKIQSLENLLRETQAQVHKNNQLSSPYQPVVPAQSSIHNIVPYAQPNCISGSQPLFTSGALPMHQYTSASQPTTTMPNLNNGNQPNTVFNALPCHPPTTTNVDYFLNGFHTPQSFVTGANYHALRKLQDLPEFSGQPEDWPLFSNAFNQSIAAYGYTNLENNQRLLKCLKGAAREVVKLLLIHPDNVGAVMEQLQFRFGRPEWLIRSQLQQLKEISPISESAIEKLIPFATKAKNLSFFFLQSVNSTQHLSNPTLLEELVSKLPISKRMDWARYAAAIKPYPTVVYFSNWLSDLANLVCTVQQSDSRRGVVLHTMENTSSGSQPPGKCPICKGEHKVNTCKKFLDSSVSDRWA